MRVLVETLFLLAGLGVAFGIGWASAWSYSLGADNIWVVTYCAMGVTGLMGVRPLIRAYREDRARMRQGARD